MSYPEKINLRELGSWVEDYRPTKVRITFTGGGGVLTTVEIMDTESNTIAQNSGDYSSLDELDITFQGYDMDWLYLFNSNGVSFSVQNIEFYG